MKKQIMLEKIRLDGGTQPRVELERELISEYADAYTNKAKMPPLTVFFDGVDHWLVDGFHRWHAARRSGIKRIEVIVHNGDLQEARWFSYTANQAHGQRRSNEDKRKAVKAALQHPKGSKMSDNQIAEHCGVVATTVGKYRAELEADSLSNLDSQTERTGRDGRTIDTANIGTHRRKAIKDNDPDEMPAILKLHTDQEIAEMLDISVADLDKATTITNSGRKDLVDAVTHGDITLDEALEKMDTADPEAERGFYDIFVSIIDVVFAARSSVEDTTRSCRKEVKVYLEKILNLIPASVSERRLREVGLIQDDESFADAITCPNCGAHDADDDGDCTACHEPGIVKMEGI